MLDFMKKTTLIFLCIFIIETTAFSIRSINDDNKSKNPAAISKTKDQVMTETSAETQKANLLRRKDSEASMEESSDDSTSYPTYSFSYEVRDPTTGDDKQHEEKRDGDFVQGQYSYIEPDGGRRIVAYMSNGTEGFSAIVVKINASELTLPIEEDSKTDLENVSQHQHENSVSKTENILQHQYESSIPKTENFIPQTENNDCKQQQCLNINPEIENFDEPQQFESQIPNESKTYMTMEEIQKQISEYEAIEGNKEYYMQEEIKAESQEMPAQYETQTMIMNNYENESEEEESDEKPSQKLISNNEQNKQIESDLKSDGEDEPKQIESDVKNSNEERSVSNYNEIPQTHIISYPMTVMHTHVYSPMPILFKLIPVESALGNQIQEQQQVQEEQDPKTQNKVSNDNKVENNLRNENTSDRNDTSENSESRKQEISNNNQEENQESNVSKKSKKSRRHNLPNTKQNNNRTHKLRVSYKSNLNNNNRSSAPTSQISNRKVNEIRKRGSEIMQEIGGQRFESYW